MTVYNNIASPLRLSGLPKNEIDARVHRTAEMLYIDNLLDRLPSELSGGQQQRTAIARALIKETKLLLLDEPLVNLDYKLRESLRIELQQIFQQREAIVVYTTTEPAEALMLGGNVVIMHEGRILQSGPTTEVFRRPASVQVANIFSDPPINFVRGKVKEKQIWLEPHIRIPLSGHLDRLEEGDYLFGIRCNHLFLKSSGAAAVEIRGKVELSEINGSETFIHISCNPYKLVVQEDGVHQMKLGREISVFVDPCHFFVYNTQNRLTAAPEQFCCE